MVAWEVGVRVRCGRGEGSLVEKSAFWPSIHFPPSLQKHTKKDPGEKRKEK